MTPAEIIAELRVADHELQKAIELLAGGRTVGTLDRKLDAAQDRLRRAIAELEEVSPITAELYAAIKHTLDQVQENPDVRYYAGPGCQIFYLLVRAEAAYLREPLESVEERRKQDRQPSYRKREPEILRVREQLDELRRECGR